MEYKSIRSLVKDLLRMDLEKGSFTKMVLKSMEIMVHAPVAENDKYVLYMDPCNDQKKRYFYNLRANKKYHPIMEIRRVQEYAGMTPEDENDEHDEHDEKTPNVMVKNIRKLLEFFLLPGTTLSDRRFVDFSKGKMSEVWLKDMRCWVEKTDAFLTIHMDVQTTKHRQCYHRVRKSPRYFPFCVCYIHNHVDRDLIESRPIEHYFMTV